MVMIQGNKTYFLSSRLHLPPGVREEEPTVTFCQINYLNINGRKWKLKNATYLKLLYITDCVLLVLYCRNEWSLCVSVLTAQYACTRNSVSDCSTLKLTSLLSLNTGRHSTALL